MRRQHLFIGGLAAAVMAAGSPALAATTPVPANDAKVQSLAADIAKTARQAETRTSGQPDQVAEKEIETTVQELVVTAGQPPVVVRDALQRVMILCIRPADAERAGINCPGSPNSYAALRNVLGIVVSLLQDSTSATDPGGPSATAAALPIEGGGGADYR